MAKQEFLNHFRVARNLYFHPRVNAKGSQTDADAVATRVARAAIWLTPNSVKGFDADDFSELGPKQKELQTAVRDFLEVANQVPASKPAAPEQLAKARSAFTRILEILERYQPSPQEGADVEEALKRVEFPPWIVNWDYELGSDHDGDPAVWINLYADDEISPRHEFGRAAKEANGNIWRALAATGSNRLSYIRMRTAIEHKKA